MTTPGAGALTTVQRARLAALADELIPGGSGLPAASAAGVHEAWIDRTLASRPDLADAVIAVISGAEPPGAELPLRRRTDRRTFEDFALAVSGAYFMNPQVRALLGYPAPAPRREPIYPEETEYYLEDGILNPVIDRGEIYRCPE